MGCARPPPLWGTKTGNSYVQLYLIFSQPMHLLLNSTTKTNFTGEALPWLPQSVIHLSLWNIWNRIGNHPCIPTTSSYTSSPAKIVFLAVRMCSQRPGNFFTIQGFHLGGWLAVEASNPPSIPPFHLELQPTILTIPTAPAYVSLLVQCRPTWHKRCGSSSPADSASPLCSSLASLVGWVRQGHSNITCLMQSKW